MLRPECLNPKDVLKHLNNLGYCNITPQQLKEFLYDLKKLIKYEQKQASQSNNFQTSECRYSCADYEDSQKLYKDDYLNDFSNSVCSTSATCSLGKNLEFNEINKQCVNNPINSEVYQKAQISFIRPWNLQRCKSLSSRGRKNLDPVRLYHQYKEFWDRLSIPGENKHSELRWVIRNRMLGQEPNPRVHICNH